MAHELDDRALAKGLGSARAGTPSPLPPPRSGRPPALEAALVERLVRAALEEDRAAHDVTSSVVPSAARARARLVAKAPGVLAGIDLFVRAFRICDPDARVELLRGDGETVGSAIESDEPIATVVGDARALLAAERTALNFLQRASGIATATALVVEAARTASASVRILDTRKTTPGLRALERYAVRCGGGENHRFALDEEVLVKENHIALAGRPIEALVAELRRTVGDGVRVTVEARSSEEARAAVAGGADVVLLDNQGTERLRAMVVELRALAAERPRPLELEASGGVDATNVAEIAATGVDRISIGALTHSAPALDLALYLEPAG